jgi:hypothetical protein
MLCSSRRGRPRKRKSRNRKRRLRNNDSAGCLNHLCKYCILQGASVRLFHRLPAKGRYLRSIEPPTVQPQITAPSRFDSLHVSWGAQRLRTKSHSVKLVHGSVSASCLILAGSVMQLRRALYSRVMLWKDQQGANDVQKYASATVRPKLPSIAPPQTSHHSHPIPPVPTKYLFHPPSYALSGSIARLLHPMGLGGMRRACRWS